MAPSAAAALGNTAGDGGCGSIVSAALAGWMPARSASGSSSPIEFVWLPGARSAAAESSENTAPMSRGFVASASLQVLPAFSVAAANSGSCGGKAAAVAAAACG